MYSVMGRMAKDLSEGVGGQVIGLIYEGCSQRQVAANVRLSKGTVQRTLERLKNTQFYSSFPKPGRPRSATPQD